MSILSSTFYHLLKLSGVKKVYSLPEDEFLRKVEKINRSRNFSLPQDKKAYYSEKKILDCYSCLTIQMKPEKSERAILFFFGGGMMIGPDKGDIAVTRKLAQNTGCDIWFPYYPLCGDHCIMESYKMSFECYRQVLDIYGAGNVSTCGFSSGGALALGIAAHNNALGRPLAMPRHIITVSPGEVPWNEDECEQMKKLNPRDAMVDYAFMEKVEKYMRHGQDDVPEYMIHISKGDFSGVSDIHFYYSEDEVLYAALPNFRQACEKDGVTYTVTSRKNMLHCYPMLPYYREAKEDFQEICAFLKE